MTGIPIVDQNDTRGETSVERRGRYRCLVLTGKNATVSKELLRGLIKRGSRLHVVDEACRLLVELAQEAAGVVILASPQQIHGLRELLAALKQYYPRTACWRCETVNGQTRLLRVHKATAFRDRSGAASSSTSTQMNALTSTRHHGAKPESLKRSSPHAAGDEAFELRLTSDTRPVYPLITQEEMAMLIGPDFGRPGLDERDRPRGSEPIL